MSDKLSIYVVEDMAITRAYIKRKLQENGYHVAGSSASAEKAWVELQQNTNIDLVLLDINLAGDKNGIWLATQIRKSLVLPIVYLTAFGDSKTLEEVVKTKPDGYLMKPYNGPTLLTTITIALEHFTKNDLTQKKETHGSLLIKDTLYIKDGYVKVKIKIEEIMYVQSDSNYLHIFLKNKRHTTRGKLTDFYTLLDPNLFQQTHRRYIVNLGQVNKVGADFIDIEHIHIPLSSTYKKSFNDKIALR